VRASAASSPDASQTKSCEVLPSGWSVTLSNEVGAPRWIAAGIVLPPDEHPYVSSHDPVLGRGISDSQARIVQIDRIARPNTVRESIDHGKDKCVTEALPAIQRLDGNVEAAPDEDALRPMQREAIDQLVDSERGE